MNEDLLALQTKVSTIIYNPFINLKEQAADLKKTLSKLGVAEGQLQKLDETIATLDQLENLNHGSVERIKGFNKAKSTILKVIKESAESVK
ncbi:MAG: hypothetical protein JNL60_19440 [Bacteroidia bacterium]|nr:hypothetical protein [Bacteroidia bacterium]